MLARRQFRNSILGSHVVLIAALPLVLVERSRGQCDPDFTDAEQVIQDAIQALDLKGFAFRVEYEGDLAREVFFGDYDGDTLRPIASAGKLISASVLMSLVDDGVITLDDTTAQWLGWAGEKGTITVRQLFTHTSGLPVFNECTRDVDSTLEDCVAEIYQMDLIAPPGTEFHYGGCSMHVAGRICEVATGRAWVDLFAEHIKTPLNMTSTEYLSDTNPGIEGGISSTPHELANLMRMYRNGGSFEGEQVLGPAAVDQTLTDQTRAAVPGTVPPGAPDPFLGYGIGNWIVRTSTGQRGGEPLEFVTIGAFGTTAWYDRPRDLVSVYFVYGDYLEILPYVLDAQSLIGDEIDSLADCEQCAAADLNDDGTVGFEDLSFLLSDFGCELGGCVGDVDGDGDSDIEDLSILLSHFGETCAP